MSRQDVRTVAIRQAVKAGVVPYVSKNGRCVTLVLSVTRAYKDGRELLRGHVQSLECASCGLAKSVQARALADLTAFPEHAERILPISLMYAEAALRHATRARRRPYVRGGFAV